MRYSYIILFYSAVAKLLLILRVFTSFYAGFNALFESDLKKLIALSTLSHLGFIGLAFFSGLVSLAFFHLLAHALFKSLLFIAIGDIIINLFHSQDIRFLSMGSILTPSSCGFIGVSLTNLLGIPSIRGFFSKDLILETLNFSSGSSFLIAVVYLNVLFTFFYTLQLLFYFFSPTKTPPLSLIHVPVFLHPLLISILALISVSFGFSFLAAYSYSVAFLSLPFFIKVAPLLLLALIVISLLFYGVQPVIKSVVLTNYFSSIINLLHICISISSFLRAHLVFSLTKYCELGVYRLIPNVHVPIFFQVASNRLTSLSSRNPLILALLSLPFLITIMAL
jgi:NADH:ubiquinone oxidoreductase subunit 5 (subunit L)/multisubunit Na+/H+ antiporter MnhA subunit